jgi:hypothetical protein
MALSVSLFREQSKTNIPVAVVLSAFAAIESSGGLGNSSFVHSEALKISTAIALSARRQSDDNESISLPLLDDIQESDIINRRLELEELRTIIEWLDQIIDKLGPVLPIADEFHPTRTGSHE